MFSISIAFGNANNMIAFLYKTEDVAREVRTAVGSPGDTGTFMIKDDFGQEGEFSRSIVNAVFFENLEISKLAQIERGLHQMRTQVQANQMAGADPKLKAAAMLNGGGVPPQFMGGGMPRA